MAAQRREVYFAGHVQGVGFRDAARRSARGFAVSGFVRNLPDGRVHLVVEGEEAEVASFLGALGEQMSGAIRETKQDIRPATSEFTGFQIRF